MSDHLNFSDVLTKFKKMRQLDGEGLLDGYGDLLGVWAALL